MNTKTLTTRALGVIDQYKNFRVKNAVSNVPYFNNKTVRSRAALRVFVGKGSPKDIYEEIESMCLRSKVSLQNLTSEDLSKILVENNLGIDCSGFAYYILNAENEEKKLGALDKKIKFVNCLGLFGKMRCAMRPVENFDVATLADSANSTQIELKQAQPGDVIVMTGSGDASDRDHVLVIHQVDYQNFVPTILHYSHAIAYPENGLYGTGVKQGKIEIQKSEGALLTDTLWTENNISGSSLSLFVRAQKSNTSLRRLNWWK